MNMEMMKYCRLWLLVVAACVGVTHVESKELSGVVVDRGGAPLPYATMRLKHKNIRQLADSAGRYTFDGEHVGSNDTLCVSYIGFASRDIPVSRLTENNEMIALDASPYELGEVLVRPRKYRTIRKGKQYKGGLVKVALDRLYAGNSYGYEFHSTKEKPLYLDKVGFYISDTPDALKHMNFRVNVYDMSNVSGDADDKFVNVLAEPIVFEFRANDVRNGKFVWQLPNLIMLPEHAMVELEFLETRKNERIAVRTNVMGKSFWSRENGMDFWVKCPLAVPFFIECVEPR